MTLSAWRTAALALATASVALLGACRPAPKAAADGQRTALSDTGLAEEGYAAPPQVLKAETDGAGAVVLKGSAGPGAMIQLQSPEGESQSTTARASGAWTLRLAAVARPRMYALSEVMDHRVVHAEGALIVLPRPAPAALLARAGFGALILEHAGSAPSLITIDYDPGGFAAFSGTAQPGATVRLSLDGAPAGLAQVDPMGRYAVLAANHRLSFGPHLAMIETGAGEIRRPFQLIQPGPLTSPYQAVAAADGWHVEWVATGGGVQTTLVLAPVSRP
jgi:hypothetical protein